MHFGAIQSDHPPLGHILFASSYSALVYAAGGSQDGSLQGAVIDFGAKAHVCFVDGNLISTPGPQGQSGAQGANSALVVLTAFSHGWVHGLLLPLVVALDFKRAWGENDL